MAEKAKGIQTMDDMIAGLSVHDGTDVSMGEDDDTETRAAENSLATNARTVDTVNQSEAVHETQSGFNETNVQCPLIPEQQQTKNNQARIWADLIERAVRQRRSDLLEPDFSIGDHTEATLSVYIGLETPEALDEWFESEYWLPFWKDFWASTAALRSASNCPLSAELETVLDFIQSGEGGSRSRYSRHYPNKTEWIYEDHVARFMVDVHEINRRYGGIFDGWKFFTTTSQWRALWVALQMYGEKVAEMDR